MRAIIVTGAKFSSGDHVYDLIAEDGEHLASHICSAPGFAYGDLYGNRDDRKEMFDAKGITEAVWLADSGLTIYELLERNKEWAAANPAMVGETDRGSSAEVDSVADSAHSDSTEQNVPVSPTAEPCECGQTTHENCPRDAECRRAVDA